MDIPGLITHLSAELVTPSPRIFAQIIQARTGGFQVPLDASAELVSRLTSTVNGQIYPVTLRESPTFPNIVYTLVSSQVNAIDGYRITQSDRFVLEVRSTTYATAITIMAAIKTALDASSYAIEFNDLGFDWDAEQRHFRVSIDLEFTYLSAVSQAMPALFVYGIGRTAGDNQTDLKVQQRIQNSYALVIVANGATEALCDALRSALLGWQQGTGDSFEYESGTNLEGVAGLEVWREIYRDGQYIEQS